MVRHVVAAAYEQALPLVGSDRQYPLMCVVEGASPILQCMRFAVESLPPHSEIPTVEG